MNEEDVTELGQKYGVDLTKAGASNCNCTRLRCQQQQNSTSSDCNNYSEYFAKKTSQRNPCCNNSNNNEQCPCACNCNCNCLQQQRCRGRRPYYNRRKRTQF